MERNTKKCPNEKRAETESVDVWVENKTAGNGLQSR